MSLNHKTVLPDDDGYAARLAELGLMADELRDSVTSAYSIASGLTSNHPRLAQPFNIWSEMVAALRDAKAKDRWVKKYDRGYETICDPGGICQVAVSSGNSDTGIEGGRGPRTKGGKGPATRDAVNRNQLSFPGMENRDPDETVVPTWLLMHTYDPVKSEIRCELSLPMEMEGKIITEWSERIILDPIPFEMDDPVDDTDLPDDDDPIDIDVPRRPN